MRYIPYQTPMCNGTSYQSVPTIGNIGGYGYYNQFYNPYYIRQQQEAQRQMEIQRAKNQADIWVKFGLACNAVNGSCRTEDEIREDLIHMAAIQNQYDQDEEFMDKIRHITTQCAINMVQEQQAQQQMEAAKNAEEPEDVDTGERISFYDWLHGEGQKMYDEVQNEKLRRYQHNASNLYNTESYNQLLTAHDSVFSSLNKNVTIDDMEIQVNLPERIRQEREIRRQRFAKALMEGGI